MQTEEQQPASGAIKACRDSITAGVNSILCFRRPPFHLTAIEESGRTHTHEIADEDYKSRDYTAFLERVCSSETTWPVCVMLHSRECSAAMRISATESMDGSIREIA